MVVGIGGVGFVVVLCMVVCVDFWFVDVGSDFGVGVVGCVGLFLLGFDCCWWYFVVCVGVDLYGWIDVVIVGVGVVVGYFFLL